MMALLLKDGDVAAAAGAAQEQVLDALLQELAVRSDGVMAMPGIQTRFMLHAAGSGAIRPAATERMDIFETQGFEDDIVRLVVSSTLQT